jgi:tRNA1Val (adenine37-N6)-methyltransferase
MRTTCDSISLRGAGIVEVLQPADGHRFTLDSILLADFCRIRARDRVLEPGAGSGIISLLLAKKHPCALLYPVEVQDDLYALCRKNHQANGLQNVIAVHRDIRRLSRSIGTGRFDVVVANPPYVKTGAGRQSPEPGRRAARQDLLASIEFWLDLQKFLNQGGRYTIVFPAARLAELCSLMTVRKLAPKRMRLVHPYAGRPASLVLVEAVKEGGSGLDVLPPLVVHTQGGGYTAELKRIYGLPARG